MASAVVFSHKRVRRSPFGSLPLRRDTERVAVIFGESFEVRGAFQGLTSTLQCQGEFSLSLSPLLSHLQWSRSSRAGLICFNSSPTRTECEDDRRRMRGETGDEPREIVEEKHTDEDGSHKYS